MIERILLWLCKRFNVHTIDYTRKDNGNDAIIRGQRWEEFAREEGGLFDMIDEARREAFEAYADTHPNETKVKDHLARQDRCWRQLQGRVEHVITTGHIKAASQGELDRLGNVKPIRKSVA